MAHEANAAGPRQACSPNGTHPADSCVESIHLNSPRPMFGQDDGNRATNNKSPGTHTFLTGAPQHEQGEVYTQCGCCQVLRPRFRRNLLAAILEHTTTCVRTLSCTIRRGKSHPGLPCSSASPGPRTPLLWLGRGTHPLGSVTEVATEESSRNGFNCVSRISGRVSSAMAFPTDRRYEEPGHRLRASRHHRDPQRAFVRSVRRQRVQAMVLRHGLLKSGSEPVNIRGRNPPVRQRGAEPNAPEVRFRVSRRVP